MDLALFRHEMLEVLKLKCPLKYKTKYSNEYFLEFIMIVLTDLQHWSSLRFVSTNSKYKYHIKIKQFKINIVYGLN